METTPITAEEVARVAEEVDTGQAVWTGPNGVAMSVSFLGTQSGEYSINIPHNRISMGVKQKEDKALDALGFEGFPSE